MKVKNLVAAVGLTTAVLGTNAAVDVNSAIACLHTYQVNLTCGASYDYCDNVGGLFGYYSMLVDAIYSNDMYCPGPIGGDTNGGAPFIN